MVASGQTLRNNAVFWQAAGLLAWLFGAAACDGAHSKSGPAESAAPIGLPSAPAASVVATAPSAQPAPKPARPFEPIKVEVQDSAMGTSLHFIAFSSPDVDEAKTRAAIAGAIAEMRRLERVLSEWTPETEIGQVNAHAGEWVTI